MLRTDMLTELRSLIDDTAAPYAWSDTKLMTYLAEGQDKFCEKTGYFIDKTNFTITTVAGTKDYTLDPRIYKVLEVWDGARRLTKFKETDRPSSLPLSTDNTSPVSWQTDAQTGTLTLYEPPTGGLTLTLRVWRYSRVALDHKTNGAYDTEPEIPSRFHYACIEYAAYKAFNSHDRELQDPVKASDHFALFENYCSEGAAAFRNIMNADPVLQPNPLYSFT